ncbi:glycoside hydrolase superfamily [Xylariales sp. PMI_506]|nr:glycoside hydrolase superfamily [Xylariales sp. PMI_506]
MKSHVLLLVTLTRLSSFAFATLLQTVQIARTPNGFNAPPRGWNSFGLQANPETNSDFHFNQEGIISQCDNLAGPLAEAGYTCCSLDSGWSVGGNGDDYGRIIYDDTVFDIPALADHLHSKGLLLGVYVLPGAFVSDESKTILNTNTTIGSVCSGDSGFARCNFDYSQSAVQIWHNSVVDQFSSWGVDFIKLDYVTPGSPDNGGNLPEDSSGSVIAWHKAIQQSGRQMHLGISWKLDRSQEYFSIWEANADTMRTDQDINNGGSSTFVSWGVVQRAIDNYRQYITTVAAYGSTLTIYPDMDSLFVGNPASVSGVTDAERQTIMTHWIGAAASLILGSDLTNLDTLGLNLLTNSDALAVADFTARYPMQPRNPGTGSGDAQQLQAWVAGPDDSGALVVVLANYGPDQGDGGFGTSLAGLQTISATWDDLGISGSFDVFDVWNGKDLSSATASLSAQLDEGESVLYKLTPR